MNSKILHVKVIMQLILHKFSNQIARNIEFEITFNSVYIGDDLFILRLTPDDFFLSRRLCWVIKALASLEAGFPASSFSYHFVSRHEDTLYHCP